MTKRKSATIRLSALLAFTNGISAIIPECIININEQVMYARVVDTANVSMVLASADLERSNLDAKLGFDAVAMKNTLSYIAKVLPGDTLITMQCRESKDSARPYLELEIRGESKQTIQFMTFDKRTIRKEPNPPSINLPVQIDVAGPALLNAVSVCACISDAIRIAVDNEGVCTLASKGDNSQCKIEVARGGAGQAVADYSLDYMKDITKFLAGSPVCTLNFTTDHPIRIVGKFEPGVTVVYLLAPRIDIEDKSGIAWL